jgi:hypothetical protein
MSSSSALQLSASSSTIVSVSIVSTAIGLSPSPSVCLDSHNFMVWKEMTMPSLAGGGLHGDLDGTETSLAKMIRGGP